MSKMSKITIISIMWYSHAKRWSRVKNHKNHAQFTRPPPLNVAVPREHVRASLPVLYAFFLAISSHVLIGFKLFMR